MEFEDILPAVSQRVSNEKIVDTCRRFADVLTERSWDRGDVLGANIQRTIKRIVTFAEPAGESSEIKTERTITVVAGFRADKDQIDFDEEKQQAIYEKHFTISASLQEQVRPDELPEWAMEKLAKHKLFRSRPDDDASGITLEEGGDMAIDYGLLYACDFERITEMEYTIDDEGFMEDFTIMCRYIFDEKMFIDERRYSWSESMLQTMEDEGALLSEADVDTFNRTFDTVMREILSDDNDDEEGELDGEFEMLSTEDVHYRRMLGMIALNAKRFIGMRIK